MIPYRLLMDAEEVVVHRHPHVRVLYRPAAVTVLVVAVAGLLVAAVPEASTRAGIVVVAVLALLIVVPRPVLRWMTTTLTVTDRRVLLRSGMFTRHGRDIPLGRIVDVSFEHTLVERMLGAGTLYLELVTGRGVVVVQNVPGVEDVHGALYQLLDLPDDDDLDDLDEDFEEDTEPDEEEEGDEPAARRRWLRRPASAG